MHRGPTDDAAEIEVKTTSHPTRNYFQISLRELQHADEQQDSFWIYRITGIGGDAPTLLRFRNPIALCAEGKMSFVLRISHEQS